MLNLTKISSFGVKSLSRINYHGINKTIIRTKRQIFSRRPVKILTDSGKDYFQQNDYKEAVSSSKLEIKPNILNESEKKVYNNYYDEGFDEQYFDYTADEHNYQHKYHNRPLSHNNRQPKERKSPKTDVNDKKINDNMRQNSDQKLNKKQTKDWNQMRDKSEKVLKPKIPGIPVYEKISDNNSEFVHIMSVLKQRKRREKENLMLLEGKRLISDAIDANIKIKTIYFTKEENLIEIQELNQMVSKGVQLKKVLYRDMQLLSELTTSPGVIAICERPDQKGLDLINSFHSEQILPLILIGDNIRDPGNLGTMVRCAAAVGAQKLVLLKGCADVWESKVLRSGAGAHFRIPIFSDIEWPLVFNHIPIDKPFDLFIADSNDDLNNKNVKNGNISEIPSHSINTMSREIDYLSEQTFLRDESYNESNPDLIKYRNLSIAPTSYSDTKFYTLGVDSPTVLVIGGETHGLSNQSYKLAYDYIGRKIKIPLAVGVDSLNSSIAAAVIMYEMRRQFECRHNSSVQTNV